MYLSDFICANYSLPSDCADLMDETKVLWRKHQHAKLEEQSFDDISDILRLILPSSWMQWYAAMSCIYAESPDCEARILLGAEHDEPERHDEL